MNVESLIGGCRPFTFRESSAVAINEAFFMGNGGTWVERDTFESKAFLELKGFAPQLLLLILGKRSFSRSGRGKNKSYRCMNNGHITFTHKEAREKYNLTIPRFTRAIDELLEKGFIEINHQGGGIEGDKTIYSLSDSFLLWRPGSKMFERKKENILRGFCKPKKQN